MGLAGLFLALFLVVHLGINLTMLLPDGGETFRTAVHFMTTNPLIKVSEIFLFGGIIIHIIYGVILSIQNWVARPVGYKVRTKSTTSPFSKYMIYTGGIIFIFLAIHLTNFYFVKEGWVSMPDGVADKHDFYTMAALLFKNPAYSAIYIVLIALLGFHLTHAIESGFQTLGLNHSRYTPIIKAIGTIYAIVISVGFIIIPVYFLFFF